MTNLAKLLTATAAVGIAAAPAAAQYYPQPNYQQTYPQQTYPQQTYPQQTYPQQTYPGYGQRYQQPGYSYQQGTGNVVTDIIDQLLGNRYSVTDRQAVRRCAAAATAQAGQYGGNGYGNGYGGNGYGGYNNGYNRGYGAARVSSITSVQRRGNGLRVEGLMSTGGGYGNQAYGYANRGYGGGQLSFRCNVDYNGAVSGVRVRPVR
jgi:hypothetical protein